jgi:hypothetical protein
VREDLCILRPSSGDFHPTQTESQDQEDMGMLPSGGSDGTKVILVDVTSTSGISKHAKLHQYTPGAVGGMVNKGKRRVIRSCGISSQNGASGVDGR